MFQDLISSPCRTIDEHENRAQVDAYLQALLSELAGASAGRPLAPTAGPALPHLAFDALTSRDFCYLSKSRARVYERDILAGVEAAARRGEPIRFYYDIGGGYHASIRPGVTQLVFDIGLAELLVLRQIAGFSARIQEFYAPGVRFSLVIDNLCALLVNDIPVVRTLAYCQGLRQLIREIDLEHLVDVLVESEQVAVADFGPECQDVAPAAASPTSKEHHNVERFLGRTCGADEAAERTRRYRAVVETSERLLAPHIRGIHMTQRATAATICFRPFPGGDSRIQCGEVALTRNVHRKLCPVLLTSANVGGYDVRRYPVPGGLPGGIAHVTYAERCTA
jgi:hypothetical protein